MNQPHSKMLIGTNQGNLVATLSRFEVAKSYILECPLQVSSVSAILQGWKYSKIYQIDRQNSVKKPPSKNTLSNNTFHKKSYVKVLLSDVSSIFTISSQAS